MMDVNAYGVALLGDTSLFAMWTWHYLADGTKLGEYGLCGACSNDSKRMPDVTTFVNGLLADGVCP